MLLVALGITTRNKNYLFACFSLHHNGLFSAFPILQSMRPSGLESRLKTSQDKILCAPAHGNAYSLNVQDLELPKENTEDRAEELQLLTVWKHPLLGSCL